MKTIKNFYSPLVTLFLAALLFFSSCKPKSSNTNESELITTAQLVIKDAATQAVIDTVTFKDPDGDGVQSPTVFDSIVLSPATNYAVELILLDESKNPIVNITSEIREEADAHLFVYTATPASLATILITDKDSNNLPLGITTNWSTGNAGRGTLSLILKHQPGVKNGTPSPGDTDVSIDFPLIIQ